MIILLNERKSSVEPCMEFLKAYCEVLGQRANVSKSPSMVGRKAVQFRANVIQQITGFSRVDRNNHMEYLGVPKYQGKTTTKNFTKMIKKSKTKIDRWSNKILST